MPWRTATPLDAAAVRALLMNPSVMRLTTLPSLGEGDAAAIAIRAVSLDAALVFEDGGVHGWIGGIPIGPFCEVSGLLDVAWYGVLQSVTIGRAGVRALNPLLVGVPIAVVNPSNTFAMRCLYGSGILIGKTDTASVIALATEGLSAWQKTPSPP